MSRILLVGGGLSPTMVVDNKDRYPLMRELCESEPMYEQVILCHLLDDVSIHGGFDSYAEHLVTVVLYRNRAITEKQDLWLRYLVGRYTDEIRENIECGIIDPEISFVTDEDFYLDELLNECAEIYQERK